MSVLAKRSQSLVLVLDEIRSGHNVGAAFRLADAFGVASICLCGITARPPHPQIHKTALGAELTVPWVGYDSTLAAIGALRQEDYHVAAVEQATTSRALSYMSSELLPGRLALIFGNEVWGVKEEVLSEVDTIFEIPQYGSKKSLNVSTAMAVVLWEAIRGHALNL